MMNLNRLGCFLALAALTMATPGVAQQTAPDNTKINREAQPTADQAKNGKSDLKLMQEIRHAVEKDSSLSTYAHNVKIVASHGKVTLRGVVRSEEEKKSIESKAVEIAGAANVNNMLSVKAK
jgi:hyperosmotically inducible periplasmic protein